MVPFWNVEISRNIQPWFRAFRKPPTGSGWTPNHSTSVFLWVFLYVHYLVSGRCPLWLGDGSRIIVLVNYMPYIYILYYIILYIWLTPVESFETPICSRICPMIYIWLVVWNHGILWFSIYFIWFIYGESHFKAKSSDQKPSGDPKNGPKGSPLGHHLALHPELRGRSKNRYLCAIGVPWRFPWRFEFLMFLGSCEGCEARSCPWIFGRESSWKAPDLDG